tara:strand:- start:1028 stop:1267 length:240 start_codon:yes stop_codon:yes gene_type:complete
MSKLKINERTVEALQLEIDHHKREKVAYRRDNDSLRTNNVMLIDILTDLTNDESYWKDDPTTKTMLWRLKNILNNIKNS